MSRKNTRTVRTLTASASDSVPVFFPDLSTMASLPLPTGAATAFPPSDVGGCWFVFVPAGKTAWLVSAALTEDEEADFALVKARGWPIVGPIYYPIAFDQADVAHLVPDGSGFDVQVVRQRNEGAA